MTGQRGLGKSGSVAILVAHCDELSRGRISFPRLSSITILFSCLTILETDTTLIWPQFLSHPCLLNKCRI